MNKTDSKLALWIALLPEDVTYQDLLDKQSTLGEYYSAPYELRMPAKLVDRWGDSSSGKFYTFLFYEEGEYSRALGGLNMDALWFCAPFRVVADTSNG